MTELLLLLAAFPVSLALMIRVAVALVVGLVLYCGLAEPGQGWGGGGAAIARRAGFALVGAFILFTLTARWAPESANPGGGDGRGFSAYVSGVISHRLSHALPDSLLTAAAANVKKKSVPYKERALLDLKRAVANVPESAHFKRYLAVVQAENGDYSGALRTLYAAMEIVRQRAPERAREERALWFRLYGGDPTSAGITVAGRRLERYGLGWLAHVATLAAYGRPGAPPAPEALRKSVDGEAGNYVIGLVGATLLVAFVLPLLGFITLVVGSVLIRIGTLRPVPGINHPVAAPLLESFILMLACWVVLPLLVGLALGGTRPTPETQPGLYSALLVVGDFLQLPAVLYLALRLRASKLTLAEIGLTNNSLGANILIGVLAALVIMPAAQLLSITTQWVSDRFFPNIAPPYHPLGGMTATNTHPAIRAALFFAAAIGAPILEEIFFRGALFGSLRRRFRFWPAALVSSAFFAILHPQLPLGFIPIFALAIGFAALTEWRRSLIPNMVAHAVNNSLAMLMMTLLFPPSG